MKTLEELMAEFRRMCAAERSCIYCKYKKTKSVSECRAAYIYDQLVETRPGKEDSASSEPNCRPRQNGADTPPTPATADKMEAVRLPKWCKEGQWVTTRDIDGTFVIRMITEINGSKLTLENRPNIGATAISYRDVCEVTPIYFRPYTLDEAEALLGAKLRYIASNGMPVTTLIHTVSQRLPADPQARINNADFSFYAGRFATIDGVPIGVPEVDTEAMKEVKE